MTRGVALLLLPLYTRYLTTDDYGILAIVAMVSSILSFAMPLGMTGVVYRFHHQFDTSSARNRFYGAVWSFVLVFSGIITVLLVLLGRPFFEFAFAQTPFSPYVQIAILIAFLNSAFIIMPAQLLRINEQALHYVAYRFLQFFGTVGFTVLFVVVLENGVKGAVYAQLLGVGITAIVAFVFMIRATVWNFQWRQLKPALAYSLPLMPHFLSHWVLRASDRAILEQNVPLSDVGVYSLGYQAGSVIQMVVSAANAAFMPIYSRASKDENALNQIPRLGTYYVLVIAVISVLFVSVADILILLATPSTYHESISIIPWVVMAYFAMSFYYLGVNLLGPLHGESKSIPIMTVLASIVNIAINVWFIPRFGIIAAAISTTISYMFLAVLVNVVAAQYKSCRYEYDRLLKVMIATTVVIGVKMYMSHHISIRWQVTSVPICLTLFVVILAGSGFLTEIEKETIGNKFSVSRR